MAERSDDDYTTAAQILSEREVRLVRLERIDELLGQLEKAEPALCVIDLTTGLDGAKSLRAVRSRFPQALVVGLVDPRRPEGPLEAFQRGAFDVLSVPVSTQDFGSVVRNVDEFLALADPTSDGLPAAAEAAGLVLESESMRRLMELVQRVGAARCHVMIAEATLAPDGRRLLASCTYRALARPDPSSRSTAMVGRLRSSRISPSSPISPRTMTHCSEAVMLRVF